MRVGVIGLGIMGSEMATNLMRRGGFDVAVFNRTPSKTEPLAQAGARVMPSIAELARQSEAVVTMVSDDRALTEVMDGADGVLVNVAAGSLVVDSSTVTPGLSRRFAERARERGCDYLDAPVTGSSGAARDAQLFFIVGGAASAFERARPLFDAMGRAARHVGASGAGSTLKLVNNMVSAALTVALAEAELVAESAGVDPGAVREILAEGAAGSPLVRRKIPKMQGREFSPEFALALMHKDVGYFIRLAAEHGRPSPSSSVVAELFRGARMAGWGSADTSALVAYFDGASPAARESSPSDGHAQQQAPAAPIKR
jgi:3-hydroxyisobutyrate dehydrogenase-like beta-hydroxyacid dehydrogenase